LWQANWVKAALLRQFPHLSIQIDIIKTKGDKILDVPLAKVGGKGLFVKEIETALLERRVDIAVHSMKDMPSEMPQGLCIAAIPEREVPGDVLIARNHLTFSELPQGAHVGTSSLRRGAQLLHRRPDLTINPLRGNLDTRLRKLQTEHLDAIVVAAAGVKRLQLEAHVSEYLDANVMLPAVGQGALCIETRASDPPVHAAVGPLDHAVTRGIVTAERAFLHRLEGGCQVPIAGHGRLSDGGVSLTGLVATPDGKTVLKGQLDGRLDAPEVLGRELADKLLSRGARDILVALTEEED
jgi:hydroxymethylbilane synthase